jgi:hypothetical protein
LYAFVNHTNFQPAPLELVGLWTLNGSTLSRFVNPNRPEVNGGTYWQVQGYPTPLTTGTYRFQMMADGRTVADGSFTVVC